jgi:glycosyltransferase involved in cell wall biosynthesis
MKILWFVNTPSLYDRSTIGYNGGGWIESLERIISDRKDIALAISFYHADICFKKKQGNVTYYPISLYNTRLKKIKHTLFYSKSDEAEISSYLNVINDFKPDIIHIFGSEKSFGLVAMRVKIPVVIHIQGILNPNLNAYFTPGTSLISLICNQLFNLHRTFKKVKDFLLVTLDAKREVAILKNCKYYMGRTDWDKSVVLLYSPKAKYYYCSEVLREEFYTAKPWSLQTSDNLVLSSTISRAPYKGMDIILKTAKLLKELTTLNFEWNVFGVKESKEYEQLAGVSCEEVNINLMGVVNSKNLITHLHQSDIFIHPSYIDNSPNSICEAQMMGLPVIATNVGGVP